LDTILWIGAVLAEFSVITLCIRRRMFHDLPVFCFYVVWTLIGDLALYPVRLYFPNKYYLFYLPEMVVDSIFQFAVLVELGWSVLKPIRASLPRRSILFLALLIAIAGAAIWPIAGLTLPHNLWAKALFWVHLEQTVAILRVAIFLTLAGFSQLLSIGWKNRELQIATGLGFYSLFSFAVSIAHSYQSVGPMYSRLDQVLAASYVCSVLYWVFAFATKEAERREFTPQMEHMLLAVAGAARSTRISLSNSSGGNAGNREKR
jgi:hypothetical protein